MIDSGAHARLRRVGRSGRVVGFDLWREVFYNGGMLLERLDGFSVLRGATGSGLRGGGGDVLVWGAL